MKVGFPVSMNDLPATGLYRARSTFPMKIPFALSGTFPAVGQ
jgi:hypothetical protein